MKKKIKKVFGINIEQEIRADFDKEIIRANNVRCKIVLIILCVPMIPYVIHLFLTSDPELPANCLILFIELIGLYLLFFHENAEYIGTLHILIMVVCLAWSQYVNYMNDQSAVNYMPYLIGLMGLAAVAYLRPLQSVVLFGLNHLVFLLISFHVIKDGTILLENSVNSTIAVLFSILFSISNYHSKLRHSVNKKLLTDLHEANAKLTEYVHKDVGTGINNRRALNERLDTEWENALIFQKPLSFMMIDIDFFKQYNDTYGHSRGDVCLREVAQCISDITKKFNAYVARFGGEEFSVLLPDMNEEEAAGVAERIRTGVKKLQILHKGRCDGTEVLTISIGVTSAVPTTMDSNLALIDKADKALYCAKERGRNRVESYHVAAEEL